ncbi:TIGR02680 family protein [Streptomyces sp. NBC_01224]|uniref:TIGR02680 family protein n=1 Tax=Streptomyces sp. NBC_01224 TaxID=2903783 RepID=UPI002E0D5D48|nr:TIGR02680 family protein [Streptomyces sp. NBC_01224]
MSILPDDPATAPLVPAQQAAGRGVPTTAGTAVPAPARSRWQPLRIGLVDLFYYDREEFWFRDGRLLLRGNNGTGKSKVLALTLPFLLDGDLSARRVEPDADPSKRMEWNLLLGGEHPHPERLGYTWVEFGRLDERGQAHFRTLMCGLKAVSGRGIARHWFAVTDQRIGPELSLLDATGTALSRDRLADAVAGRGTVYDQAGTYRRAVDEALFGLGEQRYAALVDLLVQLRQPQLSKRPNEAALSRALTEALPPMDQAVIADVAEAFRSLDEEKEELRAASEAERAASAFLEHYRRYARIASRRRARMPRTEHARYERLQRDLSAAQAERGKALEERASAQERGAALEEAEARLKAQDAALRAGPEMRSARELEQAGREALRTGDDHDRAAADRDLAMAAHRRAVLRVGTAQNRLSAADGRLVSARLRGRRAAQTARIDPELHTRDVPEPELRRSVEEAVARRQRTVDLVAGLTGRAERAAAARLDVARRLDDAEGEVGQAGELAAQTADAVTAAGEALLAQVREHVCGCRQLRFPDPVGLLDRLQDWLSHLNGPSPAQVDAADAHRAASAALADLSARLVQQQSALAARRDAVQRELAALEAGGGRGPQVPYTRTPGVRERATGAPLWRLVDFHDHVPQRERALLEAALEASGLLDAWVCPDGSAVSALTGPAAGNHDVLVAPGAPVAGTSLAQALRPAVDREDERARAVGEETVGRLLVSVGLGAVRPPGYDSGTWVAVDGRFRVGALTGSWSKEAAEYVGEGAREAARRVRLSALRDELTSVQRESAALAEDRSTVAAQRGLLDEELAALPDDGGLRQAHARAVAARETARRAVLRRDERSADLAHAADSDRAAVRELAETAADVGLSPQATEQPTPATAGATADGPPVSADPAFAPAAMRRTLASVQDGLADHRLALAEVWPALRERTEAGQALAEEQSDAEETQARVAELTERTEAASHAAASADEHHRTLRSTVGAAVAELEQRLAETAGELGRCVPQQKESAAARAAADRRASHAEGRIEQLESGLDTASAARTDAVEALRRFASTGLIGVAVPELVLPPLNDGAWAVTPAVALARGIEAELSAADDSDGSWERVQRRLSEELKSLQDALSRHGHTASARMVEDGMVVDIVYQGRERAVPELAEALATEVGELQRILSAHEREILETHLLTEVAGTLQELIGAAERQVRAMNAELEERPTSTGMKLRLVWRSSRKAPTGLARAREQLRQSADAWSPEDRAAVGEFLQSQITLRQSADVSGSRLEQLTAALDYRAWHEFGIERHQHGRWVSATGPASGGERVLAVSVPLFAAASSHYATAASPHAPRLVTLDEAFAGVDDDSRAKCLGLLHAFDLDVVMTSEREWACYPQVPGVAIAQLSRIDEVAAVLVTRWEWDGTERARGFEPDRGPVGTRAEPDTAAPGRAGAEGVGAEPVSAAPSPPDSPARTAIAGPAVDAASGAQNATLQDCAWQ